jgi:outer membrane protein TolC
LFFGTLLLEAKAKQNDELQKVLSSNLSLINANVKGGTAMESDAETVKAELLSARQQRIDIEEAEKAYRSMLSIFTGKNLSNEVTGNAGNV